MTTVLRSTALGAVVVIYQHGLLGEGLGARLRLHGVPTTVVDGGSPDAVASALAGRPAVVITEGPTPDCRRLIGTLSPDSRVVDVSKVIGRGCQDAADIVDFAAIMDALGAR